ncbi:helix-turn-helix domain-containing protein [Pseudomonas aeruginosa]|uniref:helix-turn-helix domain-containing protein n=1 Tax=Pseudomonas aeruginosa TaxID=287 RepID=UPI00053D4C7F|nr:helix-turn-helix transcriptional regulator [Pseudomonas aeruginosa]KSQ71667.1 transcriptional regulator [Pseudomonas aeruginosa]MCV6554841.1 helix-turn-helix domain-containing protein [Pseudomonas aeruginosa]QZD68435.1 helix-turn-helix domain-containing protein [Pseudomonas aeruginosa]QZH54441.1 helix-turn-helix domain-containing protein [Pseudomonas aeruginosa]RQC50321.1 XRE family transcriptional regulator [Pseudomonas aeruginosa]
MDTLRKSIGAKIKAFRTARSLTQDELASVVETDSVSVSRYERGVSTPSVEQLLKIARALNVTPGELLPVDQDLDRERLIALRRDLAEKALKIESTTALEQLNRLADSFLLERKKS